MKLQARTVLCCTKELPTAMHCYVGAERIGQNDTFDNRQK